jgi:CheY-like chemotaxis protein
MRVLVVEDNADHAQLLGAALEMKGCDVVKAADGAEALAAVALSLKGAFFDLIILDIAMMHVDGMTFLKALRCFEMNELFARPPHVKVHTAHSEARSLVRQGRIADADYYEKGLHGTTRLLSDLEAMICRNDSRPSAG